MGGGAWGRFLGRVLEQPGNPMGWSVKLFTAGGVTVRMHLFTIVFVAGLLLWSLPHQNLGPWWMATAVVCLVLVVLVHELGHCVAARRVGGQAARVVMLPYGGLDLALPPPRWRANLITALGGPAVNVVLAVITSVSLAAAGLGETIVFDPFAPAETHGSSAFGRGFGNQAASALWTLHYVNVIVLGLNLLLPMYPFDGGRILQALLWSRTTRDRSVRIAAVVGLSTAVVVAVAGLLFDSVLLVAIAAVGGWASYMEGQRLRMDLEIAAGLGLGEDLEGHDEDLLGPPVADRIREALSAREQEELDRILAKIGESGMKSLAWRERRVLRRATSRRRRASPPESPPDPAGPE